MFRLIILFAAVLLANPLTGQSEGPLIEALIKKGVLTSRQGEEIRADLTREFARVPSRLSQAEIETWRGRTDLRHGEMASNKDFGGFFNREKDQEESRSHPAYLDSTNVDFGQFFQEAIALETLVGTEAQGFQEFLEKEGLRLNAELIHPMEEQLDLGRYFGETELLTLEISPDEETMREVKLFDSDSNPEGYAVSVVGDRVNALAPVEVQLPVEIALTQIEPQTLTASMSNDFGTATVILVLLLAGMPLGASTSRIPQSRILGLSGEQIRPKKRKALQHFASRQVGVESD